MAAKVAARDHTLEGKKLTARLEKTPEMMRDRVLLTKLPSISSKDELLNFVEAKTGLDVQTILFGEKNTVALVIFEEKVIGKLNCNMLCFLIFSLIF